MVVSSCSSFFTYSSSLPELRSLGMPYETNCSPRLHCLIIIAGELWAPHCQLEYTLALNCKVHAWTVVLHALSLALNRRVQLIQNCQAETISFQHE
jgi:hypothetical protein